jgi:protocatechuate 3,4-dioxygenase beta subunit
MMNLLHIRARRMVGVAVATALAVVGVGIATPASAEVAQLTINGTVVDSSSAPVADQAVTISTSLNYYNAVTDASGQFTVAVEYDTNMAYVSVNAGYANAYIDPPSLGGATETSIVLTLPDVVTVTIEGYVADAYGVPLAGTRVWAASAVPGGAETTTATDGYYSLTLQALAGGFLSVIALDYTNYAALTDYADGDVIRQDFTIGSGNVSSVELVGTFLDPAGAPLPFTDVYISADQNYWQVTTDANGNFVQVIEYGEFAAVNLYADHAGLTLDPSSLLGQTSVAVVLQQLSSAHVTIEGTVFDLDGNTVAGQLVFVYGDTSAYTRSDAAGHYSLAVLADPFAQVALEVEDGDNPYDIAGYSDGDVITQDVIVTGSGYEIRVPGVSLTCDVNGNGIDDIVNNYLLLTSGQNVWQMELDGEMWNWDEATFGEGEISAAYCADVNGDGASELIAQGSHEKVKKSGTTVTKNDWWIYDYATDTATARTFPNGEISGVVFENLDADPGVEMIVERLRDAGPNTFWILDDATAEVEKIRVGFGSGGTLEFADFDGIAGTDIVTTKTKPNGTVVTEYYTRASGEGQIVTVKTAPGGAV